jgi:magnesium transporter
MAEEGGPEVMVKEKAPEAVPAIENKAFCVVIGPNGAQRMESQTCRDFLDMIQGAHLAWIDYVVEDVERDLLETATRLGFSELLVRNLQKNPRSGYEDFDNELGLMIPAIFMQGFDVKLEPLYILIRGNSIVTLHTREVKRFFRMRRYAETLMRKIPEKLLLTDKITHLLIRIIDENNSRNFDYLVEIEEHGDQLSQELSDPKTPRSIIGPKIYEMKHALIVYLGGLWGTVDILDRINALIVEVQAQIGLAEHLSEVLASGLEVLQSIYNNQLQILNNKLAMLAAYLAIIGTALLVPNTIATIAGNQMFQFTPDQIPAYLGFIILSTVVATIFTFWVLKSRGLLPRDIE